MGGGGDRVARCVPNAFDDAFIGTLPVAMAEIEFRNASATEQTCGVHFDGAAFLGENTQPFANAFVRGERADKNFLGWVAPAPNSDEDRLTGVSMTVPAGGTQTVRFMMGHWERAWPTAGAVERS